MATNGHAADGRNGVAASDARRHSASRRHGPEPHNVEDLMAREVNFDASGAGHIPFAAATYSSGSSDESSAQLLRRRSRDLPGYGDEEDYEDEGLKVPRKPQVHIRNFPSA